MPWCFVLADAAVSGMLAYRRGYTIAKSIVERRDEFGVSWFLIDELSRMSRNTIESLRLGELAADTGVRVIGASDGFDSAGQQSKIMLPMMSSFHEVFIDQLKSKVKRGMDDAFLRGENIQPPGVGYRMVPVTDPDGNVVFTHKGTVEKRAEIDPALDQHSRHAHFLDESRCPAEAACSDEPRARIEMMAILQELQRLGKTIIISSHILSELQTLCNRCAIIEKGRLIYSGPIRGAQTQLVEAKAFWVRVGGPAAAARDLLLARPEASRVEIQEDRIKVVLADPAGDGGFIAETLVTAGQRVLEMREDEIGLEEVFLRVTRGETQ